MALLTTTVIDNPGILPALVAAAGGGDTAVPGPGVFLEVNNAGGASITVTLVTPATVDSVLTILDRAVTVTNATRKLIRLDETLYRDPSTGLASITYSGVTSVTVGVFRVS